MGIVANGNANYIRKINDAYSQSFAQFFLNQINISIKDTESIKSYLKNKKIKGALIGINYTLNNFETINLKEKGYYSFYFFTDDQTKFNHGIVLEILNYNIDVNKKHIFQKKIFNNFATYYGLDYDQFLFQRASIALIETNSDIFDKNEITLKSILEFLSSKKEEIKNSSLIDLSKDFCILICEYLNLYFKNIYNVISDRNIPKGKGIISEKILNKLNQNTNKNSNSDSQNSLFNFFN